jgi:protein-tyrosine kinase
MSRIEKVLEKAAEMRGSGRETTASVTVDNDYKVPFSGFEVGVSAVNIDNVDTHIVCVTDPNSVTAEQYKKLRARVLQATAKNFHNTIMVTSADMGEGKTITATNLAVAVANEIDYTVLLVDTDFKHPSVHKYLGFETPQGLSDCLAGKAELSQVMIKTGIGKLVLLPAGSALENATELLSSEKMKKLVNEMKYRYKDRYVIFDSAPILVTADSIPLSSYVDGVLLVIQAARSTPKAVSQAISQIKSSNILGVVFNDIPRYLAKNLYPYYYHYKSATRPEDHADSGGDDKNNP